MLQPFYRFKPEFIERLIRLNKPYLVSQSYPRGVSLETQGKTCILLNDYDDVGLARTHLNAVGHDKFASIINLNHPPHREKLQEMLSPQSGYAVFWGVIKNAQELALRITKDYKHNMRRYVEHHTRWRIGRETELRPKLTFIFGEIYVVLKWNSRELRIKFDEIETS